MHEKEKIIKEQKLNEVITLNLKGLEGKFGVILKYLGYPLTMTDTGDSGLYRETEFQGWHDIYGDINDDDLPEEDIWAPTLEYGRAWDGLKHGMHIEITYLKEGRVPEDKNSYPGSQYYTQYRVEERVLTVTYKGHPVYREYDGELDCFVKGDWINDINRAYDLAVKVAKEKKIEVSEEQESELSQAKKGFLTKLREKWGI